MNSKKTLVALAVVFTLANGGIILAADEPVRNVYNAFGVEDPDPDLDGVSGLDDQCPGSPFDIKVINKYTKKQKAVATFSDPQDKSGKASIYLRVKTVNNKEKNGNSTVTIETASNDSFTKNKKSYSVDPKKITTIDSIARRIRVLYSNSKKGLIVVWVSALETKVKGCVEGEYHASADEVLTPP